MTRPAVLIVDDDQAFADSLVALLNDEQIPVEHAADWERGLDLFRAGMHELVVADFNLPGSKHGLQLLAAAKAVRPSSRLILISGALLPGAEELVAQTGFVDRYVVKGDRLAEAILPEARQAAERSMAPTDWPTVAHAHGAASRLHQPDIDALDNLLRLQLRDD